MQVAGQNIGGEVRVETTCRAADFETVSVPAGTFEALRADCTESVSVKASAMGIGMAEAPITSQYSEWYAAGVGLVKRTEQSGETVLLSYRLP